MLEKVAVVGAGNVGATAAQRLAEKNLARTVVMIDVIDGVPQGKGLDQWQSGPIEGFDTRLTGTGSYDEAAGAEGDYRGGLESSRRHVLRGHEGQPLPAGTGNRNGGRTRHCPVPDVSRGCS